MKKGMGFLQVTRTCLVLRDPVYIAGHSLGGDLFICKDPTTCLGLIYSRSNR
jgi:hypothetical protein